MKIKTTAASLAALSLVQYTATAQMNPSSNLTVGPYNADSATNNSAFKMGLSSDYSAVAAGGVHFNNTKGDSGAQSANANLTAQIPLNDDWFIPFLATSRNLFLGTVPDAPIPNQINTLGLNTGLGYHLNDQWTIVGAAGPRFYDLSEVNTSGIGIGGAVRATYKWEPNLTVAFGLAVEPDRDVPVLPAAGVRWDITTDLTLSVMFPRSGLDYRVNDRLTLFAGFDGNFAVYRADSTLGDKIGMSQFNNGLATYRDFRVGGGLDYKLMGGLSATVEGGYSFDRALDYQRIDETVKFDSAPYIQGGLKYRF